MTDICSIWAYDEIKESGKLGRLHGMYLSIFSESSVPLTMNQCVRKFREKFLNFPYKTHHGMGSRISELTDFGFLEKVDVVICEYTNKRVNRWKYTGRKFPLIAFEEECICDKCNGTGKAKKKIFREGTEEEFNAQQGDFKNDLFEEEEE